MNPIDGTNMCVRNMLIQQGAVHHFLLPYAAYCYVLVLVTAI